MWSSDGKQIFYQGDPGKFFVVDVGTEPAVSFEKPSPLPFRSTAGPIPFSANLVRLAGPVRSVTKPLAA